VGFFSTLADDLQTELMWIVGGGVITTDDVFILGLVHVSSGSWQILLQLQQLLVLQMPPMIF
jgi:hypothetical protein